MDRSPLAESLRLLQRKLDPATIGFYALLLVMTIAVASINFLPGMQRFMMRKFHYTQRPFTRWAIGQFLPSMYNFHNEIIITRDLLVSDFQFPAGSDALRLSVNHYPFRIVPFHLSRSQMFLKMPFYVYIRSSFRNQSIVSSYSVTLLGYGMNVTLLNSYERSH